MGNPGKSKTSHTSGFSGRNPGASVKFALKNLPMGNGAGFSDVDVSNSVAEMTLELV